MATTIITSADKDKLYTQVLHLLGMPVRGIELTEEQMDSFLEMAVSEYEEKVSDWLIESQWSSLIGINLDTQSLTKALTQRSLDYETQYTYAYSKIVGLQANGPWELKKDYFSLVRGQQIYEIPAGREINELLWFTRSTLSDSTVDPFLGGFGGMDGFGLGYAQMGTGGSYFMFPAADLLARMQDRNIKNRLIGGDLTYRITAGANGTKLVHLHNTPGGKFDFGSVSQRNCHVWYWYYETTDRDTCLDQNPDVVKLPSDVMTEELTWAKLNKPSQNWVRKWFIAYCKEGLGRIWAKYSGDLKIPDSEVKLDYVTLMTEAKDERMILALELKERLERLRPDKQIEMRANEAENLNKSLKYRAMPNPYHVI